MQLEKGSQVNYRILLLFCLYFAPVYGTDRLVFSTAVNSGLPPQVCAEIMALALSRINIDMELSHQSVARAIVSASNGETDGETARVQGLNAKYPDLVQVEVSCYAHNVNLFVLAGDEFTVEGWHSIPAEKVIGYRKGTHFIELAAARHNLSIYPLETKQQVFKLIKVGKVDMMLGTAQSIGSREKPKALNDLVMLEPALERHSFYSYIHKRHLAILPKINQQLLRIKVSGEMDLIQQKYIEDM
jgi:polar amino acid transport system substrate-binding protein